MSFPFPFYDVSCHLRWKIPQIQKQQDVFLIQPLIEILFNTSLKSIGQWEWGYLIGAQVISKG